MKTNIIIPAAGKSSRFPNMRPKWLQTHPNGNMMFAESLSGIQLNDVNNIYLVVLRSHIDKFSLEPGIIKQAKKMGISEKFVLVVLDNETVDQPETIYNCIKNAGITGAIFIKDTDNYFLEKPVAKNSVSVYDLNKCGLINPRNKSYVQEDASGNINSIVEKKVISSTFCVGGYSFQDANDFVTYYEKNRPNSPELYVSDIIHDMILNGEVFSMSEVLDYKDWGTVEDWNRYKSNYATLFVDLDGTLVENSGEYFPPYWGSTPALEENVTYLNELHLSGKVKIIITTSRKLEYKAETLEQLERIGLQYDQVIFELFHAKRVVINDYSLSNPYKSCDALNLLRDSRELKHLLTSIVG